MVRSYGFYVLEMFGGYKRVIECFKLVVGNRLLYGWYMFFVMFLFSCIGRYNGSFGVLFLIV